MVIAMKKARAALIRNVYDYQHGLVLLLGYAFVPILEAVFVLLAVRFGPIFLVGLALFGLTVYDIALSLRLNSVGKDRTRKITGVLRGFEIRYTPRSPRFSPSLEGLFLRLDDGKTYQYLFLNTTERVFLANAKLLQKGMTMSLTVYKGLPIIKEMTYDGLPYPDAFDEKRIIPKDRLKRGVPVSYRSFSGEKTVKAKYKTRSYDLAFFRDVCTSEEETETYLLNANNRYVVIIAGKDPQTGVFDYAIDGKKAESFDAVSDFLEANGFVNGEQIQVFYSSDKNPPIL
jgi:hypothetical protein